MWEEKIAPRLVLLRDATMLVLIALLMWLRCADIQRRRLLNLSDRILGQIEILLRSSTSCIEYKPGGLSLSQ